MEEENVEKNNEPKKEEKVEVNNETKKFDLKGFDYKKYLPYAGIAVAVIAVIIILVALLGGGPKKAVKGFVSGMNKQNASKIVKNIDFVGMSAWGYYYDEDDFSDEDYDSFIEDYEEYEEEYGKEIEDEMKDMEDSMEDSFDDIDDEYKSYKIKIEEFKKVEELGKDLYAVDAKISIEAKPEDKDETDEIDESEILTFIVYKDKLISFGGLGF